MKINEININKILVSFLITHLVIWTLIPSISNTNLPLDTIEALAWGSNLDWGYNKHPPFSAWAVEFFYKIFKNQDWAYYFLSQIFVVTSFFIIFKFSEDFFKNKVYSLLSILLLEGIFFYNFTSPEFNVNISQLPFWALTVYFCWEGIKKNDNTSWLLFGFFAGLGFLSKYLFIYLLASIDIILIYLIIKKRINLRCLVSFISFFIIILPHLIWLIDNNYTTIFYALHRTGIENTEFFKAHIFYPFLFLGKQIILIIPFFIMFFFLIRGFKIKINYKDKKMLFLFIVTMFPIILMFLTSLIAGITIRTMWMTPFYLFISVLFLYLFKKKITFKKLNYFVSVFLFFFIISPISYFYISISETNKRTDYPGKKISQIVEKKWDSNFINKIGLVAGDEWHGGNLSYHLKSRPKWDNILENTKNPLLKKFEGGFILIGDVNTLSKICSGVFFEVEKQGVCMIGKRK